MWKQKIYICYQDIYIYIQCVNCSLSRVDPPDDEQQACSKHAEANYWNKLIENSASCWFILYEHITNHGQQNVKKYLGMFVVYFNTHFMWPAL